MKPKCQGCIACRCQKIRIRFELARFSQTALEFRLNSALARGEPEIARSYL